MAWVQRRHFEKLYRFRWIVGPASLLLCVALLGLGITRVGKFSEKVDSFKEPPPKKSAPKVFDARLDIWFDSADPALKTFYKVEEEFIPEDTVLVAFEDAKDPWGVFGEKSMAMIARLTAQLKEVPYVRHVRSLTQTPWVRWGEAAPGEEGLLITDLFENDPSTYTREQRLERMIAVLGAERAAKLAGEQEVRGLLGADAKFEDYIGEPRLINGIVSPDGKTAAIMVQLLRPKIPDAELDKVFGDDERAKAVAPSMHVTETQWLALDNIKKVLDKEKDVQFHITGMPTWERNFAIVGEADMKFLGLTFLGLAIVLFIVYRRFAAVGIPMLVVVASILGMNGAVFLSGNFINNVTALVPFVVISVSIGDSMHLVSVYYQLRPDYSDKRDLIVTILEKNAVPVFITSASTAIGFFSMVTTTLFPMKLFGIAGGLGTVFSYLMTMTLTPALLSLIPLRKKREKKGKEKEADEKKAAERKAAEQDKPYWTDKIINFTFRRRKEILIATGASVLFCIYGAWKVQLHADFRTWFPRDPTGIIHDMNWIDARITGSADLELIFSGPAEAEDATKTAARQSRIEELEVKQLKAQPALSGDEQAELKKLEGEEALYQRGRIAVSSKFLTSVDRFEKRLRAEMKDPKSPLKMLTKVESGLDVLRKIHQVQNQNKAEYYRIPTEEDIPAEARKPRLEVDDISGETDFIPAQDAASLSAQYYIQYENGAKPVENLSTLISPDRRTFRLAVRAVQESSERQQVAFARIREILKKEFPELIGTKAQVEKGEAVSSFDMTGRSLLFANMIDVMGTNVIVSLLISMIAITIMFIIFFRSFVIGAVAMIPNVLPIAIPLCAFGVFGWFIDAPAAVISSICLGVAVDDTTHIVTKFRRARAQGYETKEALRLAYREVGLAVTYTTLILVIAFSLMRLSDFHPNITIGKLASIMLALSWVFEIIVAPAMLSFYGARADKAAKAEKKQ